MTASAPAPTEVWLTRKEVAAREKMPVATLAQWAHKGQGPRYALFGRHARYRLADVIAWENAQFGGDVDAGDADPGDVDAGDADPG